MTILNGIEMYKLRRMLDEANIKYVIDDNLEKHSLRMFSEDYGSLYMGDKPYLTMGFLCTLNEDSIGHELGYLEIHTSLKEQIEGFLTAEMAFDRIKQVCSPREDDDYKSKVCVAEETETWEATTPYKTEGNIKFKIHFLECSECRHTYEHVNGVYEYCPRCGRKVIGVYEKGFVGLAK